MSITEILSGYYEPDEHGHRRPESLYGSLKMWAHLQRQGVPVARSTVQRLMRAHRWRGATRAATVRTTVSDPTAQRAPDLVNRQFSAKRPDALWVADFTYVPMTCGFGYTAFVIDAFAVLICGWACSLSKHTRCIESAIRQANTSVTAWRSNTNSVSTTWSFTGAGGSYDPAPRIRSMLASPGRRSCCPTPWSAHAPEPPALRVA
jgi:transposase InsO family protein